MLSIAYALNVTRLDYFQSISEFRIIDKLLNIIVCGKVAEEEEGGGLLFIKRDKGNSRTVNYEQL